MKYLIPTLCLGLMLSVGIASAETAAPAPTKAAPKPRSAISIECSKKADAQGLHGKKRRDFRAKCKKGQS
jgi:hypothetical protein